MPANKWHIATQDDAGILMRLHVPGGWLVRYEELIYGKSPLGARLVEDSNAVGLVFVPDPNHSWSVE